MSERTANELGREGLMLQPPFDPSKVVLFDLAHGRVSFDEETPARVLVPADALCALAKAAGEQAASEFGKALGTPLGHRVARRLGGGNDDDTAAVRKSSIDTVVDHLGGELALIGLGTLGLERWGRALLFTLDQSPLEQGDEVLASVLEGALQAATGPEVRCIPLMRDATRMRLLVAGQVATEKARSWLTEGISWGEVLARLHTLPQGVRGEA